MRRYKQAYILDGKEIIDPSKFYILHRHTARKDRGYTCLDCDKEIKKGEEYIERSQPFYYGWLWHVDCFKESHGGDTWDDVLIVIRKEIKYLNSFGIYVKKKPRNPQYIPKKTYLYCIRFKELFDEGET